MPNNSSLRRVDVPVLFVASTAAAAAEPPPPPAPSALVAPVLGTRHHQISVVEQDTPSIITTNLRRVMQHAVLGEETESKFRLSDGEGDGDGAAEELSKESVKVLADDDPPSSIAW